MAEIKAGFCFDNAIFDDAPQANIELTPDVPLDLSTIQVHAKGGLVTGSHDLMLSDRAAHIEVQNDTLFEIELACKEDSNSNLSLDRLSLSFSTPIRIANLFTTMDEVSVLIADTPKSDAEPELLQRIKNSEFLAKAGGFFGKRAAEIKNNDSVKKAGHLIREKSTPYFSKIANSSGWKTLVSAAEKTSEKAVEITPTVLEKSKNFINKAVEIGEETIDKAFKGLDVISISIESEYLDSQDKTPCLRMIFSGEGFISEKLRIPLKDIEFPRFFLSRFVPELSQLLAQFCVSGEQGSSLSKTFIGMIKDAQGEFDATFDIEKINLRLAARGGRFLRFGISSERSCSMHGSFDATCSDVGIKGKIRADIRNREERTFSFSSQFETTISHLIECGAQLNQKRWALSIMGKGNDIHARIKIEPGSRIFPKELNVLSHDPRLKSDLQMPLILSPVPIEGELSLDAEASCATIFVRDFDLRLDGNADWDADIPLVINQTKTHFPVCSGNFKLSCSKDSSGQILANLQGCVDLSLENQIRIMPVPELKLSSEVSTYARGHLDLCLIGKMETENVTSLCLDCDGSKCHANLNELDLSCGSYRVHLDGPVNGDVEIAHLALTADGISESLFHPSWALAHAPVLYVGTKQNELLLPELMDGHISVRLSEQGRLGFENGEGFFDEHFFTFVLYPDREREKMISILQYEPLLKFIEVLVKTLEDVTGPGPVKFLDRLKHWNNRCKECGIIVDLNHASCMRDFARMISLFCFDNFDEVPAIKSILDGVVEARGVDRYKTEELLDRAFPEIDFSRMGPVLKLLNRIFTKQPFEAPEVWNNESNYDEYSHRFRLLPSANHLFDLDTIQPEVLDSMYKYGGPNLIDVPTTKARIYKYAAGYNVRQLEWLLAHHGFEFTETQRIRLKRLVAIKRRILKQEPRDGAFLVQDFNIDYFLQTILDAEEEILPHLSEIDDCLDDFTERCNSDDVVECFASWLAPEDVARLICAGIASRIQNQLVQLNQARLFDYMVRRGRTYTMAVFYEAGACSDRLLTSLLMSFLAQDQSLMKTEVNREALLSQLLGMEVPVRAEFMPGGIHASESYYEHLYSIAHTINSSMTPYVAAKLRMQSDRIATDDMLNEETPKRPMYVPKYSDEDELVELQRGLEKADALGKAYVGRVRELLNAGSEEEPDPKEKRRVEKAYAYAYRLASSILTKYPDCFMKPVFREFYARTYESLIIQVLNQNLKDDTDQVRRWFSVRTGIPENMIPEMSEIRRRSAIIDMLYHWESDWETRKQDPLTWLDTRPEPGNVNLTILTAMGVITDGKRGVELDCSLKRLKETRGIDYVRSDTGNVKSLAYNSEQIEKEIRKIKTPYLILGYSQGCANMMRAESNLYASTPDDRACLNNMVARHFMYSALNGSPHAVTGGETYRFIMSDGEMCLKTLSATASSALSSVLFDILKKVLDAPLITMMLNGLESLSYIGLNQLSCDAQYMPGVISTELQGIIDKFVPESLQYVYHRLSYAPGVYGDTQVVTDCSHGYHVYNRNASVDILRDEMIPSCTLNAHHWYPLNEEVAYLETEQDVKEAVYQAPKDIHIVPSVEALILFGKVKRVQA